jgi:hypothetical protein
VISPVVQAFPTPALRKEREGRGTHFAGDANEIKSLGHPADSSKLTKGSDYSRRGWEHFSLEGVGKLERHDP